MFLFKMLSLLFFKFLLLQLKLFHHLHLLSEIIVLRNLEVVLVEDIHIDALDHFLRLNLLIVLLLHLLVRLLDHLLNLLDLLDLLDLLYRLHKLQRDLLVKDRRWLRNLLLVLVQLWWLDLLRDLIEVLRLLWLLVAVWTDTTKEIIIFFFHFFILLIILFL